MITICPGRPSLDLRPRATFTFTQQPPLPELKTDMSMSMNRLRPEGQRQIILLLVGERPHRRQNSDYLRKAA